MAQGMWSTKEDVLKDLEMASGRQITGVDDDFVVVGERPPPPRVIDDEENEIELRFGRARGGSDALSQVEPDLQGITHMLRMVRDYERSDEDSPTAPTMPSNKNSITVISKLNPNVKEFVPRCAENNPSPVQSNVNDTSNVITKSSCKENLLSVDKNVDVQKTMCSKNNSHDEIKQKAAMLRKKILPKPETFEEKTEASLAIVNLLKLYAKPSDSTPKPILLTPAFFEKTKTERVTPEDDSKYLSHEKDLGEKVVSQDATTKDLIENADHIMDPTPVHEQEESEEAISHEIPLDSVVESIGKVNEWFDYEPGRNKEKLKSTPLFLGPVSYKRKDPVTCKSPSIVGEKKVSKSSNVSYRPSSYAEELLEKYNNRLKGSPVPDRQLNIWEKLEADLKKRDEQIRNRGKEPRS